MCTELGVRNKAILGDGKGTEVMPMLSQAIWTWAGDMGLHSSSAYQNDPGPFLPLHSFLLPQG